MTESTQQDGGHADIDWPPFIVFIDSECTFCSNSASFMLRHDPHGRIYIAGLQGVTARRLLPEMGVDPGYLEKLVDDNAVIDSILCVENPGGPGARLFERSRASRLIAMKMGFPYNFLGWISWWIPDWVLDPIYRLVKKNRHRMGSRSCAVPDGKLRSRYLD